MTKISVFWHRRDLRTVDNTGLYYALKSDYPVQPIFIFDTEILDRLEDRSDARVQFIQEQLKGLNEKLKAKGSGLKTYHGSPEKVWQQVLSEYEVAEVYTNRDYEPYANERDEKVARLL